ncbi:MAG: hypothetical protein PHU23_11370 [Dehalococcoidales bacterium]|nr:hypothetical protein [Dehalococcoidales bacterium]
MATEGPVQDIQRLRAEQKKKALEEIDQFAGDKITLKRDIFFVPGWTGEEGDCWLKPYPKRLKGHISVKECLEKILNDPRAAIRKAHYITFSETESKSAESFMRFGEILKQKIIDEIGKNSEFDIVGHSMGGLDIVAAITQGSDYLKNVKNCITIASPLQGVALAPLLPKLKKLFPLLKQFEEHHKDQIKNLSPKREAITLVNTKGNRSALLGRVGKFYQFYGTQDAAVMRSAKLNKYGLGDLYDEKVQSIEILSASHSGRSGITQDPRTVVNLVKIMLDIEIERPKYNYGYVYKKT